MISGQWMGTCQLPLTLANLLLLLGGVLCNKPVTVTVS